MSYNTYQKPNFTSADINIVNYEKPYKSTISAFNYIMNDDFENLKKYTQEHVILSNVVHQTPLMFACYLDKIDCVKILLCEVGQSDLYDHTALFYCKSPEVRALVEEYEFYN